MKLLNAWNNAPWTPRGRKFKHTVEATLTLAVFILINCQPKGWN